MQITHKAFLGAIALGALSVLNLHAGSTAVLEGFENGFNVNSGGITNIQQFTLYGNARGNPVAISLYTAAGPGDPRVTEGTNSAKIVFPNDGYGNDFGIGLSDAACALVEAAASSNQVARYVLRYDVIFEHIDQISYFNQTCYIGADWDYVRSGGAVLSSYGGEQFGVSSFSVPLELPELGIPNNPPATNAALDFAAAGVPGLTAYMADQFAAVTEPLTNFTIYIDNIRLIDTYETPTTTPVVYTLQSFENPANPLGGAVNLNSGGTTLSLYTTNGQYDAATDGGQPGIYTAGYPSTLAQESDFAVTAGTNCLEVDCTNPYYSYDIFSLPFAGTRLASILALNLTPAQLAHYTIRWDVTTPMIPVANGGADGDYIQIDYNATTGSILPMSTGRRQYAGQSGLQRETYSLTLDQVAYWGTSPSLGVSYSQPGYPSATWGNSPFFFDNFRLIDTAPHYTVITSESYNPATGKITLVWLSEPSQTYTIQSAASLTGGFNTAVATGIPAGGDYTTNTFAIPGGASAGYFRILAQ